MAATRGWISIDTVRRSLQIDSAVHIPALPESCVTLLHPFMSRFETKAGTSLTGEGPHATPEQKRAVEARLRGAWEHVAAAGGTADELAGWARECERRFRCA